LVSACTRRAVLFLLAIALNQLIALACVVLDHCLIFALELAVVLGKGDGKIFEHCDFVVNFLNLVTQRLHLVKDVQEKGVDHDIGGPLVAKGTQPSLVLCIQGDICFQIEALQVRADLSAGWDVDRQHGDGVGKIDGHLLGLMVFDHSNF